MKALRITLAGLIALSLSMVAPTASNNGGDDRDHGVRLRATLIGFEEVPAVSTAARGRFNAEVSEDGQSIDYTLSFSGITSAVAQSHIHIGQKSVNGGITIWLCQGTVRAPTAVATITPECPQNGEVVSTITPAKVLAIGTQQIDVNNLDEVLAAIREGVAYVNVHSATSPGGEIRGQLKAEGKDKN